MIYDIKIKVLLIMFMSISLTQTSQLHAQELNIDVNVAVKEVTSQLQSDLIQNLYTGAEKKLIDETEFKILLEPYSNYVDTKTPFTQQGLNFYNKIKEDTKDLTPQKRKEYFENKFQNHLKEYIDGMIYDKVFDKESQNIISSLSSMFADAKQQVKNMTEVSRKLEIAKNSDEYASILKKYGVTGKWVDNLSILEENVHLIKNSKTIENVADTFKAFNIIREAMNSKDPGYKIEALFNLGDTFAGKVPILGKFIELYFKVALEYLEACKGIRNKLRKFDQHCVGTGTHSWIDTKYADKQNIAFHKQFKHENGTFCRTPAGIYNNIYTATSEIGEDSNKLYFWIDNKWVYGKKSNGGLRSFQHIIQWLRANSYPKKATNLNYLAREYNKGKGFDNFVTAINKLVQQIQFEFQRIYETIGTCDDDSVRVYLMNRGKVQILKELLNRKLDYRWEDIKYFHEQMKKDIVNELIYRRLIKPQPTNIKAVLKALKALHPSYIRGKVYDENQKVVANAKVEISDVNFILKESSSHQLTTSPYGSFSCVIELGNFSSKIVKLKAKRAAKTSKSTSVTIKPDTYNTDIKIYFVKDIANTIQNIGSSSSASLENDPYENIPPTEDNATKPPLEDSFTCKQDSDCKLEESCIDETCIIQEESECIVDSDCMSDEFCSDGICIMSIPDCISDSDCASSEICSDGTCITPKPECTSNTQCPLGKICKNETCIVPPPIRCTSDHDCPLDKICSLDNICVTSSNTSYDTSVWDKRESDRNAQVNDRYSQDAQEELLNRFNQEDIQKDAQERKDKFERYQQESNSHKHSNLHQDRPSNPSKPSTISSTQNSSKLRYYIVSQTSKTLEKTAVCKSISYTVVGPFDKYGINRYVKQAQKYANLRMSRYGYPIYKSNKVTKSSPKKTKPKLPKGVHKCRPCPKGQHIGLDPDKQHCHSENSSFNFNKSLSKFGTALQKGNY